MANLQRWNLGSQLRESAVSYNQQKCLAAEILTALGVVMFIAAVGIAFIADKRNRAPEYSSISCEGIACLNEKGNK